MSVEVAGDKTLAQIEEATPQLVEKLESQAKAFYRMPCEAHKSMQLGPGVRPQTRSTAPE